MIPPLKTLEEHEEERARDRAHFNRPCRNGIACPKCGAECIDSNPGIVLASDPPRSLIACSKCDFTGSRTC